MKNTQDTFSIDFACLQIQYLLSKQWIYTVSMPFLQITLANIHRWNIFIIEVLSMLASPLIKIIKPPDKKPGISDRSSFWVSIVLSYNIPLAGLLQKHAGLCDSSTKYQKSFVFAQDVPYSSIMKSYVLQKQRLVNDLSVSAT